MSDRGYTVKTIELRAGDSHFELPDTFQFVGFTPTEPLRAVFIERELTEAEQEVFEANKEMQELVGPQQLAELRGQLTAVREALESQTAEATAVDEADFVEVSSVIEDEEDEVADVSLDEALAILDETTEEVSDDAS